MIRVLHIIQQLGPGRGGVRTFVSTMLDCPAPDIEQSVLSVGRVEGDRFGERFYGPLIDSYSPLLVGTLGAKRLGAFLSKHRSTSFRFTRTTHSASSSPLRPKKPEFPRTSCTAITARLAAPRV